MESFNFGAFDPTIGARIAAIPQEAQKQQTANMLQAMQMQGAMRQNEMSQMQLDEMKTDRAEMVKLQQDLAAKGGSPDLGQYADMLMRSPKHMQLGIQLKQKLAQQAQFADAMRDEPPARTAPAAAPMAAPEPGSFSADVAARTAAMPAFVRPTNELAPLAPPVAPPVNALAAGGEALAALQQKRNRLRGIDSDQARAALRSVDAEIALASREPSYQNVPGVGLVDPRTGRVVTPSVEPKASSVREFEAFSKMTPAEQETFLRIKRTGAASTVTNVKLPPVENAYSTTFAKNTAEDDIKMLGAARNAPKVAATANRVTELLNKPDIFVGPAATVKLNVARALSVLGADETESMRNTERLIAASGQGTLDAIKDANLGTGQGFTEKDLGFLREIAGGRIDLTSANLSTMARLQHRAAELSVKKWQERRANMPKSATEGTGIDKETYELPARMGGPTPESIAYLKANPNTKAAFNKRYGDGEAEHTLRMGK
jgi:hypothetical protein